MKTLKRCGIVLWGPLVIVGFLFHFVGFGLQALGGWLHDVCL